MTLLAVIEPTPVRYPGTFLRLKPGIEPAFTTASDTGLPCLIPFGTSSRGKDQTAEITGASCFLVAGTRGHG